MRPLARAALAALLCLLAPGCEPQQPPPADAGTDARTDAGTDAGVEPDAGADASTGPLPDAGAGPALVQTAPAHDAERVHAEAPLVLTFSVPMEPAAGTVRLSPAGPELSAAQGAWDAERRVLALRPASPLQDGAEVLVTVGADFRAATGRALAETSFRFRTRDTRPPRLFEAVPQEGAQHVALDTPAVVLTFDEPMDVRTGALVAPAGVGVGAPQWEGARAVRFPLSGLPAHAPLSFRLEGFRDLAGNGLDGGALLGDGALDFATGADVFGPRLATSSPAAGATDVYPVEVALEGGVAVRRKRLTLTFTEPMDTTAGPFALRPAHTAEALPVEGAWDESGHTLTVTVPAPAGGGLPLEPHTAYALQLAGLRDARGNALDDAALPGGRLEFTAGGDDPLLDHACFHTLFGPFSRVSASPSASAATPRVDVTHREYTVLLVPGPGPYAGVTRARLTGEDYALYFAAPPTLTVHASDTGAAVPLEVSPAPPACAGITHQGVFTHPGSPELHFRYGPSDAPAVRLILEQVH